MRRLAFLGFNILILVGCLFILSALFSGTSGYSLLVLLLGMVVECIAIVGWLRTKGHKAPSAPAAPVPAADDNRIRDILGKYAGK